MITALVSRLKAPKAAPKEKDPLVLRTEAARALKATSSDEGHGSYFCGDGHQPHVHLYTDGFHLKKINGIERINVVQSNKLYPDGLKKARQAATADPRGYDIHIAIDKCLMACKESLDDYSTDPTQRGPAPVGGSGGTGGSPAPSARPSDEQRHQPGRGASAIPSRLSTFLRPRW